MRENNLVCPLEMERGAQRKALGDCFSVSKKKLLFARGDIYLTN